MEVIIIDRTEEERNKSFEQAVADGLGMTIEEIREAREEIKRMKLRRMEAENRGIILSQTPTSDVGKVMFHDSFAKSIEIAFECERKLNESNYF